MAEILEREIEFRGRTMWVKMPTPEQILVWQRTINRLANVDENTSWTASEALTTLERARKIIDSVVLHQADKDWLDDEFLSGNFGLQEAAPIIQLTVEAFTVKNRAEKRATAKKVAPAKKAVRKAPAKKAAS